MLGLIDFWLTLAKHLLEKNEEDFAPKWGNLYATAESPPLRARCGARKAGKALFCSK